MFSSKQFGSYQIIRKLARGMTDVYLTFDTRANRHAVLKIVEESPDPVTLLIMEAERRGAEIQKQLHQADSRVIELYEFGQLDGCFFIAMQYIEGRTIAEILKEEKRIEPSRAAKFGIEILSQLDHLHSFQADIDGERRAVVHGDIKPSNVQIGADDEVRLLDFGIAKALTFTHSGTHLNLGSPGYCSPERLNRGQVDHHVDLWAVGVTLYEMLSGSPPYQAADTRKLEQLIQSRRPPRALPVDCPSAMQEIVNKALAGDLHQRYVSAAAFEGDLRLFLQSRPAVAQTENRTSWNTNPTMEKQRPSILHAIPRSVSSMADTVKQRVLKLKPERSLVRNHRLASVLSISVALCWGLLAGLVVCVPAGYIYRFWRQSAPLRVNPDYTRLSVSGINSDWNLFQQLQQRNAFLGEFTPAKRLSVQLRSRLLHAADDVIERYRNGSDPLIEDFDWMKGAVCLRHALDLEPGDRSAQGKLALCEGYLDLAGLKPEHPEQHSAPAEAALAKFQQSASLIPRAPDPHLGLARIYIYSLKNVGKAIAELHEAQRLGFQLGPREMEQEADGYRFRAAAELMDARQYRENFHVTQERYVRLAQRDYDRARQLYEPILGFSNVSASLREVDDYDRALQRLDGVSKKPAKAAKRKRRTSNRRAGRWQ